MNEVNIPGNGSIAYRSCMYAVIGKKNAPQKKSSCVVVPGIINPLGNLEAKVAEQKERLQWRPYQASRVSEAEYHRWSTRT